MFQSYNNVIENEALPPTHYKIIHSLAIPSFSTKYVLIFKVLCMQMFFKLHTTKLHCRDCMTDNFCHNI